MRPRLNSRPAVVAVTLAAVVMVAAAAVCLGLAVSIRHRAQPLAIPGSLLAPGIVIMVVGQLSTVAIVLGRFLDLDDTGARQRLLRGLVFGDLPLPMVVICTVLLGLSIAASMAAAGGTSAHLVPTDDPTCQYVSLQHGTYVCRSEAGRLAEQADDQREWYTGLIGVFVLYAACLLSVAFEGARARERRTVL